MSTVETTPQAVGSSSSARRLQVVQRVQQQGALVVLVLLCAVASVQFDSFATGPNIRSIALQASFLAVIALGMTFVIFTGGIDLSVGSVFALGGVLAAWASQYGTLAALLVPLAVCGAIGLVQGLVIAHAKLAPFIVTQTDSPCGPLEVSADPQRGRGQDGGHLTQHLLPHQSRDAQWSHPGFPTHPFPLGDIDDVMLGQARHPFGDIEDFLDSGRRLPLFILGILSGQRRDHPPADITDLLEGPDHRRVRTGHLLQHRRIQGSPQPVAEFQELQPQLVGEPGQGPLRDPLHLLG